MLAPGDAPPLIRPVAPGVFELCHPRGLRGLDAIGGLSLPPEAEIRAEVSVIHLQECRDEVERAIARAGGPRIALALRGPLSFSPAELGRLAPGLTAAQIDAAVGLLLGWARRAPGRFAARLDGVLVGVTPHTTPLDLRRHLDGLHRHALALDPLVPFPSDALPVDPEVAAVVSAALAAAADPVGRQEALRQALDRAAGVPRGEKKKSLRLIPAPRYGDRRPPRTGQVDLTSACNLACDFCTARGAETRAPRERAAQAIAAVRRVAASGAEELVVSGAEPTLEWYLDDLVALARRLGFARVVLETNAVELSAPGRAEALAAAGLTRARVALNGLDERADAISGVPGALARTLAGARALIGAGVPVEIAVALLPGNRGQLAHIAAEIRGLLGPSVEAVVARPIVSGPGPVITASAAAEELTEGARAAARAGIPLRAAPGSAPPPCLFETSEDAARVVRLDAGAGEAAQGHVRVPLCERCGAAHVCPGPVRAIAEEVAARGRRVPPGAPGIPLSRERERVLRELRSVLFEPGPDGTTSEHRVIRINFHCNQACDFCFVSRELPVPEEALVEAELAEAAAHRASLAISGGEPTLNPRLPHYLARARALGIDRIQLQTNAIKMSDPAYTAELVAAGLRSAFVSLHGITAPVSDRVTAAPGTFVKTVAGVRSLLAAGVDVCLNFVLCAYNVADLAGLPDYVDRELSGDGNRPTLNFSFVAAGTENVPRDTGLVPRFSDVAWALSAAVTRARALGMPFLGFDSQCGVPACFLPEEVRAAWFVEDLPGEERAAFSASFRKGEACARCSLDKRCYGLRAAYADTYGTGELRAIP